MKTRLLDYLCCPLCKGDLRLTAEESDGTEVLRGSLSCAACGKAYPILGGVPRMLPGELPQDMQFTARNFGASWKRWSEIHEDRYRAQFLHWAQPLKPVDFQGRVVLDCGCGKGRHLRVVGRFGAQEVIGVDLSEAVDVAFANTRDLEHVHVVQGNILQLPFKGGFDVGFSVGVLHHMPDPSAGFRALAEQVRPGGTVACWVYGRENNGWLVGLVNPVRLALTRWLPPRLLSAISAVLAAILFAAIYLLYVPASWVGLRLFYGEYLLYLRALGFAETCHIVYDHLVAPTTYYVRREEVERWLEAHAPVERVLTWVRRISWAGVGKRPG